MNDTRMELRRGCYIFGMKVVLAWSMHIPSSRRRHKSLLCGPSSSVPFEGVRKLCESAVYWPSIEPIRPAINNSRASQSQRNAPQNQILSIRDKPCHVQPLIQLTNGRIVSCINNKLMGRPLEAKILARRNYPPSPKSRLVTKERSSYLLCWPCGHLNMVNAGYSYHNLRSYNSICKVSGH